MCFKLGNKCPVLTVKPIISFHVDSKGPVLAKLDFKVVFRRNSISPERISQIILFFGYFDWSNGSSISFKFNFVCNKEIEENIANSPEPRLYMSFHQPPLTLPGSLSGHN
jgi:hypothetical protein